MNLPAISGCSAKSFVQARRAIVDVDVTRISDSCGYGVPLMSYEGSREHHALSTAKKLRTKGVDGYEEYRRKVNGASLDGLPALPASWPSGAE